MKDTMNYVMYTPNHGEFQGKYYLFMETAKRLLHVKNFVNRRNKYYQDKKYKFCLILGYDKGKVELGVYSETLYNSKCPLPEIVYDIENGKIYVLKGQLWRIR
jgi:hypothetical protein